MNALISSPGLIDPIPTTRAEPVRADGRVDLVGLTRDAIRAALQAAGFEAKSAKLRAKQIWHQVYHRGARAFDTMNDVSKADRVRLADGFVIDTSKTVNGGPAGGSATFSTFARGVRMQVAIDPGMTTLRQDGMVKVRSGVTSIEEVLRVVV